MHGRERVVTFGTSAKLVGIVTEAATSSDADRPAFIMLNSGILHRVGSCRMHVRLARTLSEAGFTCLRFDYSGVGDSESRRDALPFEQSAVVETREAMDYLAKSRGIRRFVLMGLCSGADMAHETAVVDERVAGLLALDGWAYRTLAHYVHHYAPRVLRWSVWRNSIRIRVEMLMGRHRDRARAPEPPEGVEYEVPSYVRVFPPRQKLERDLRQFVQRGVRMYYVWTGGLPEYNHQGQFASAFRSVRFGNLLREEHLPTADHIITDLRHQEYLLASFRRWAEESFPAIPQQVPDRVVARSA
jgi:pimeloyl-ACP methyl ester carboxylesterase